MLSSRSIPGRPTVSGCGRRTRSRRRTSRTDHGSFIRSARGGLSGNRPDQPGGRGPAVAGRATSQAIGRGREGSDATKPSSRLLKLGTTVLPLLPDAKSGSTEVQLQLGRVRQQLETARAEEEVRTTSLSASRVKPWRVDAVIAAVAKQIGQQAHRLSTRVWPASVDKPLKLSFDNAPILAGHGPDSRSGHDDHVSLCRRIRTGMVNGADPRNCPGTTAAPTPGRFASRPPRWKRARDSATPAANP